MGLWRSSGSPLRPARALHCGPSTRITSVGDSNIYVLNNMPRITSWFCGITDFTYLLEICLYDLFFFQGDSLLYYKLTVSFFKKVVVSFSKGKGVMRTHGLTPVPSPMCGCPVGHTVRGETATCSASQAHSPSCICPWTAVLVDSVTWESFYRNVLGLYT